MPAEPTPCTVALLAAVLRAPHCGLPCTGSRHRPPMAIAGGEPERRLSSSASVTLHASLHLGPRILRPVAHSWTRSALRRHVRLPGRARVVIYICDMLALRKWLERLSAQDHQSGVNPFAEQRWLFSGDGACRVTCSVWGKPIGWVGSRGRWCRRAARFLLHAKPCRRFDHRARKPQVLYSSSS